MSSEHLVYLKNIKKKKLIKIFFQVFIFLALIIFWQLAADMKWINSFVSSSPKKVLETIIKLYNDGSIFYHIWVSLYEVLLSFLIGTILGLIIATILWKHEFLFEILNPYLTILNCMPKVSLGPIIIIIAGASTKSIILMALFISLIITVIDVHHAFRQTDINKIRFLKSLSASKKQIFFKLILPYNFSNLVNISKVSFSLVFVGVITGEFLVSKAGVGYLIMYGSQVFNLDLVMCGVFLISLMASFIYYLIVLIEKKLS